MTRWLCRLGLHRWMVWEDYYLHPLYPKQSRYCGRCNHREDRYVENC